jgi:hypothetical protein
MSETTVERQAFYAGDRVVLAADVPGRPTLKAGLEGAVLVSDAFDDEDLGPRAPVSVWVAGKAWLLDRRLLRLISPGRIAREAAAAELNDALQIGQ